MNVSHALIVVSSLALAGCAQSVAVRVVDLDNGSAPIAGATIAHYPVPHHRGDPFAAQPTDVAHTDGDGNAVLATDSGRLVVSAPGKASASVYSTFLPHNVEVGVSAEPAAAATAPAR